MAYLCSQWTQTVQIKYFMFDWSIYRLFVLNRDWKRDSLQIMIFVYVWSSWSIVELKTRFETWIKRNDVNGVSLINFPYLINLMAYLCSQWTPRVQINYFMFDWTIYRLFVLNRGCKFDSPNNDIRTNLLDMRHIKTKNAVWVANNKKKRKWWLFHLSYLITLKAYLSSQWTLNVQINYFMFDSSIFRLFVLNRCW
jgi:hypothetical protein